MTETEDFQTFREVAIALKGIERRLSLMTTVFAIAAGMAVASIGYLADTTFGLGERIAAVETKLDGLGQGQKDANEKLDKIIQQTAQTSEPSKIKFDDSAAMVRALEKIKLEGPVYLSTENPQDQMLFDLFLK